MIRAEPGKQLDIPSRIVREHPQKEHGAEAHRYTLTYSEGTTYGKHSANVRGIYPHV